jgi:hypothetical protein
MSVEEPRRPPLTREEAAALARRRRGRNIALLVVLVGVAVLFYAIAMVKLAKPHLGAP